MTCFLTARVGVIKTVPLQMVPITEGLLGELSENQKVLEA